ncbi:MAG: PIN domain-containing protein [Chloroflexi bacterium]|nr:PIN domain-containing protein [Chloroflexota bacterium]
MKNDPFFADTNLFLRYLTNDIPVQSNAVEVLLRDAANGKRSLVTNSMVIAEIVWTLESYYSMSREEIQTRVLAILNTPGLEVTDDVILFQAIIWYVEKNVDFIDAYNAAWMSSHDLTEIYSFDQKHFKRFPGITIHVPEESPKR